MIPANHASDYATVAQLVEQLIRNQQVAGSSPASSSTSDRGEESFFKRLFPSFPFLLFLSAVQKRFDLLSAPCGSGGFFQECGIDKTVKQR